MNQLRNEGGRQSSLAWAGAVLPVPAPLLPMLLAVACRNWDLALETGQDVCFCGVQLLRKLDKRIA